jgi:hypothetical protein
MTITAVLNLFKRPHTLLEQLTAIQNQSIPPENIIIWKNYVEGIIMPDIPEYLKKNVIIIESSKNFGVWSRFTCGLLVNSEYICVFDDDTIPGKDWFKNCSETMKTHCGLLGTIGLRYDRGNEYRKHSRIGWHVPNNKVEQVDIVGHSWFFKQKWLHHLWECQPNYSEMFLSGEDIGFSYILQKYGINTYVPPHPDYNKDLWGSIREKALLYGCETTSISMTNTDCFIFDRAFKHFINKGFITMANR